MIRLPIDDVLEDVKDKLITNSTLILQAPPGAGKSTRVPLALLDAPWLGNRIIIMLEPRRVAARMVATQMSKLLGEELGERVGYQVKMDSAHSKETKILVVTEAILVRMIQADENLDKIALIIFDEFHERSIYSDLSLALSLQIQELLRDDLKILIMSATLNAEKISSHLGDVPIITSQGRSYDVENIYLDIKVKQPNHKTIHTLTHKTVVSAVKKDSGDILVFLQGTKEIRNLQKSLKDTLIKEDVQVLPLYSALSKKEQDRALLPSKMRKVILATNIAQTSLTIEGVRVVIDTGLEKLSCFNYSNGMNHLESAFISLESAVQRGGRAGRVSDGKCYKLWHESKSLSATTKPEILRSDLSSLLLDLAEWGVEEFDELVWLDTPNSDVILQTKEVLKELHILDDRFKITVFGSDALSLGVHPRFAYMMLKADELSFAYEASLLVALLSEKSILKETLRDSDILSAFRHLYERDFDERYINVYRAKEVLKSADYLHKKLKFIKKRDVKTSKLEKFEMYHLGVLLLMAYPDRLALQRAKGDNRYKLSNAKGALIHNEDSLFNEELLVVASLHAKAKDSFINQALSITMLEIEKYFGEYIQTKESVSYNKESQKFDIREERYFLALKLSSKAVALSKKHDIKTLLIGLVKEEGLSMLNWSKKATALKQRVEFINEHGQVAFESFSDTSLFATLDEWFMPYIGTLKSVKELQNLDIYPLLLSRLSWDEQQELDILAPQTLVVPSGSHIFIDYSDVLKPALHVKLQEMFGLEETPKVLNSTLPLQIQLLSPAMRPIQITYDLKSFWKNSYGDVRKDLRGKYKRHYWPENPYEAVATKHTKKHMMIKEGKI